MNSKIALLSLITVLTLSGCGVRGNHHGHKNPGNNMPTAETYKWATSAPKGFKEITYSNKIYEDIKKIAIKKDSVYPFAIREYEKDDEHCLDNGDEYKLNRIKDKLTYFDHGRYYQNFNSEYRQDIIYANHREEFSSQKQEEKTDINLDFSTSQYKVAQSIKIKSDVSDNLLSTFTGGELDPVENAYKYNVKLPNEMLKSALQLDEQLKKPSSLQGKWKMMFDYIPTSDVMHIYQKENTYIFYSEYKGYDVEERAPFDYELIKRQLTFEDGNILQYAKVNVASDVGPDHANIKSFKLTSYDYDAKQPEVLNDENFKTFDEEEVKQSYYYQVLQSTFIM